MTKIGQFQRSVDQMSMVRGSGDSGHSDIDFNLLNMRSLCIAH